MERNETAELIGKFRKELMGAAALCIMVFHVWQSVFENVFILNKAEHFIQRIGFCGVDIFFFLSGFGLYYALKKENLITYYWNRLRRILIPPALYIAIRCFLDGWTIKYGALSLFGFYFYTKNIYTFLWFIPAIITMYVWFPLYNAIFEKARNKFYFLADFMIIWLIFSMFVKDIMREDLFGFTNRIPVFVIGAFFGWSKGYVRNTISCSYKVFMGFVFALGVFLAWETNYNDLFLVVQVSNCCIPNILMTLSGVTLLVCVLENASHISRLKSVLRFLGSITLELYCLQEWMRGMWLNRLMDAISYPIIVNVILFSAIIISAYVMHLAVVFINNSIERFVVYSKEKLVKRLD